MRDLRIGMPDSLALDLVGLGGAANAKERYDEAIKTLDELVYANPKEVLDKIRALCVKSCGFAPASVDDADDVLEKAVSVALQVEADFGLEPESLVDDDYDWAELLMSWEKAARKQKKQGKGKK